MTHSDDEGLTKETYVGKKVRRTECCLDSLALLILLWWVIDYDIGSGHGQCQKHNMRLIRLFFQESEGEKKSEEGGV